MKIESLSLFISLLSLIFSVFYLLSFYSFKNSRMLTYDHEYMFLNKDKTFICENVQDDKFWRKI